MTKEEVISYYETSTYDREVETILGKAKLALDSQRQYDCYAVVFDIDDTSFSHYQALKQANFPQQENHEIWSRLILNTNVDVIKPTLDFYNYCINKGVKVFFISARLTHAFESTKKALKNAGYNKFDGLYIFPEEVESYNSGCFKSFKANRRAYIESLGYKVLISIGDQSSDLSGGYAMNTFLLPNYLYGENSVF